jgi:mono/diheme cytochrome c family protein
MHLPPHAERAGYALVACALFALGCACAPKQDDPGAALVERGRKLFLEETFGGNGRTCATCHPSANNFTLDPAFIAALPADDPLFVAERLPALKQNFEKPELMRGFALILENLDGFDDLEH